MPTTARRAADSSRIAPGDGPEIGASANVATITIATAVPTASSRPIAAVLLGSDGAATTVIADTERGRDCARAHHRYDAAVVPLGDDRSIVSTLLPSPDPGLGSQRPPRTSDLT